MIPELGSFAILIALCFALMQSFLPIVRNNAALGQFIFFMFCDIVFNYQFHSK